MRVFPVLPLAMLLSGCGGLSAIGSATPDTGLDTVGDDDDGVLGDDDDDDDDDDRGDDDDDTTKGDDDDDDDTTQGDDDDDDGPGGDDDDDDDTLTFGDDDDDDSSTITDTGTPTITDTGTPQTTPTDTGTPPLTCPAPPDVTFTPYQPAINVFPDVDFMQVLVQTYIEGGTPYDFITWDPKLGAYQDTTSVAAFYFFEQGTAVCVALWDFDQVATHVGNNGWASGMYEAYELDLPPGQALTNCEGIDWGGTGNNIDPLELIANNITGVAFGPEDATATSDFETQYTGTLNWSTEVEPYMYGFYASIGGANASITGVAWGNEDSCYRIQDTSGAWLPSATPPTGGPITQYVDGLPVYGFGP